MDEENVNGNGESLGKGGISYLIELMEKNNKSSHEIERDGRNSRRHLLEIKKISFTMADMQEKYLYAVQNFQEGLNSDKLQNLEDSKEQKTIFSDIRKSLKNIEKNTGGSGGGGEGGSRFGNAFLPAFGGIAGNVMGIATIGAAIPAFFGGLLAGESLIGMAVGDMENIDFATTKKLASEFTGIIDVMSPASMVALAGLVGAAVFTKDARTTGLAMGAMGVSITALFAGLMLGDALLEQVAKIDGATDFGGFKTMVTAFDGLIGELSESSAGVLVGLIGVGGLLGLVKGPGGVSKIAFGMATLGAGITGFFAGVALGTKIENMIGADYTGLTKSVKAFDGAIGELSEDSTKHLIALLTTGGIIGTFGAGVAGRAALGMAGLGAGIGGFLGAMNAVGRIGGNGDNFKKLVGNFSDSVGMLDDKTLLILGGLLAVGGILGPAGSATAAAGMTALGTGIAGFFVGMDSIAGLGSLLGADGSNMKNLLENFAHGIKELEIIDAKHLGDLVGPLALVGPAILALFGTKGLAGITGGLADIGNFITFGLFQDDKSIFESLVEALDPLKEIDPNSLRDITAITTGLGLFMQGANFASTKKIYDLTDAMALFGLTMEKVVQGGSGRYKNTQIVEQLGLKNLRGEIDAMTASLEALQEAAIVENISTDFEVITGKTNLEVPSMSVTNLSVENAMLKLPDNTNGTGQINQVNNVTNSNPVNTLVLNGDSSTILKTTSHLSTV